MPSPNLLHFDHSVLPTWLNTAYIENALRSYFGDDTIKVVRTKASPASAKGDNYVCILSRIRVDYINKSCQVTQSGSYIVKATLSSESSGEVKAAFDSYGAYDHEIEMYEKVFPKIQDVLSKAGHCVTLVPRAVKVDHEHQSILLEDLSAMGYKMANVRTGLDEIHAKMVLKKLAKIHAASAFVNSEKPGIFEHCDRGIFNKHSRAFDQFFKLNLEACARAVSGWEGYKTYGEKLSKLLPHFTKYGVRVMEPKDHHFNVLTHGDLWGNNAMFKYNESNQVMDAILFDLQFCIWASATIDLHYFFNTSLTDDLRINNVEELVHYYYQNLRDTLQDLKFPGTIPTLQEFLVEYMETAFYAVYSSVSAQPTMINEDTEDASFNCLFKDDERSRRLRNAMFNNVRIRRNLQHFLPVFDRRGLLDLQP
ncbi:unnamed protein product [Hermetia illucens]|uniref:CHK kinase-like domain-containing protein n=1 Tax=Hermetia illucens TaxID=343691 RepID=A0A7R8V7Y5_HERIL|nr:uncharacterized protein LOC119659372 [Hermetia illucens]CAD7093802.1 unnamed protein product [Hermetia illucens]